MDKVNLKWEVNMYNISHMKFNARSHGKITVPLVYKPILELNSKIKLSQNLNLTKCNIKLKFSCKTHHLQTILNRK